MIFNIRHRALAHARACSVHLLGVWSLVFLPFLRDPQPQGRNSPRVPVTHFWTCFASFFPDLFFEHNWCPKVPNWDTQNHTKSTKSQKTSHQNAFLLEACKKTPFGRGQTSEFDDSYTLLAVFSKAQGSQKGVEMEPKWSFRIPQIT